MTIKRKLYESAPCEESMNDIIKNIYDILEKLNDNSLSDIDRVALHIDVMEMLIEIKPIPSYLVSDIITYNNNHNIKIVF